MVDSLSNKVDEYIVANAHAYNTYQSILYWRARYGFLSDTTLVCDQDPHVNNTLLKLLISTLPA